MNFLDRGLILKRITVHSVILILNHWNIFFFECEYVRSFWRSFQNWICGNDSDSPILNYKVIKFGVLLEDKKRESTYNIIIILAKQYIHKCRF